MHAVPHRTPFRQVALRMVVAAPSITVTYCNTVTVTEADKANSSEGQSPFTSPTRKTHGSCGPCIVVSCSCACITFFLIERLIWRMCCLARGVCQTQMAYTHTTTHTHTAGLWSTCSTLVTHTYTHTRTLLMLPDQVSQETMVWIWEVYHYHNIDEKEVRV